MIPPPQFDETDWSPDVVRVLRDAVASATASDYAVFDFDNTCVRGDCGALIHAHLTDALAWHWPDFLAQVPPNVGGDRIRDLAAALNLADGVPPVRLTDEARLTTEQELKSECIAIFTRMFQRVPPMETYRWSTRLYAGLSSEELAAHASRMWERELAHPMEGVEMKAVDGTITSFGRGIRIRPGIRRLIVALQSLGVPCWIVSASNEWAVRASSRWLPIPVDRVVGNRTTLVDGVFTDQGRGFVTWGPGKVSAIRSLISEVPPLLAFGDSRTDAEMLDYSRFPVFVGNSDEATRWAVERGWVATPAGLLDD